MSSRKASHSRTTVNLWDSLFIGWHARLISWVIDCHEKPRQQNNCCIRSSLDSVTKCFFGVPRLLHRSVGETSDALSNTARLRRNEVLINLWYFFHTQPISLSQIEMLQVIINVWCTIPRRLSLRLNQFHQSSSQLVIFYSFRRRSSLIDEELMNKAFFNCNLPGQESLQKLLC